MFAAEVIGVGNEYRGDDGVGPAVVRRLLDWGLPPGFCVRSHNGEAMSLLASWEDSDTIIVIDAVDYGALPGTIVRLKGEEVRPVSGLLAGSSHGLGVAEAILLARALGRLPKTLIIFGVQGEQFTMGKGMSPCVRGAVDEVANRVIAVLDEVRHLSSETRAVTM